MSACAAAPILVGNNLAILVAAYELARHGRPFTLLTDDKPLGGHFAGLTLGGLDFDMGMVLLEQHAPVTPGAALRDFAPEVPGQWTRYGDRASAWLQKEVPLVRVPTPSTWLDGAIVPDYLIANRLDAFANAQVAGPGPLGRSDPRHAANKALPGCYDTLSYAAAVRLNHGSELHARFIEPFGRKVLGIDSDDFLARYHRAGWLPLYYPETLRAALRGESTALEEYPFWTTGAGFVGQIVRQMTQRIGATPGATRIDEPLASLRFRDGSWQVSTAEGCRKSNRIVLGVPPERCHTLLGLPPPAPAPAASVTLFFARVRASAPERLPACLMVVDERYAAYRLSDQDALARLRPEWHRVVVEANAEGLARRYPGQSPEAALGRELRVLMRLGAGDTVEPLKCITAKNALVLPTPKGIAAARCSHEALRAAAPHARLTGNLLGPGVASFNDQLVQGLQIGEEFA